MTTHQQKQDDMNEQILSSLESIHEQNQQIYQKIEDLEHTVTKKATIAGAIAGGLSGAIISTGIELIKMKFGG